MTNFHDDIARNVGFARRRHANRLVILDVDRRLPPSNDLSISGNHIARAHLIAELRHHIVDRDSSGLNETIGLTPRADAVPGKKFVDADDVCHNQAGISCLTTAHVQMPQDMYSLPFSVSCLVDPSAGSYTAEDAVNQTCNTKLWGNESFYRSNLADIHAKDAGSIGKCRDEVQRVIPSETAGLWCAQRGYQGGIQAVTIER